jgi:hypothetical protein
MANVCNILFLTFPAAITGIQFVSSEPISLSPISLGCVWYSQRRIKTRNFEQCRRRMLLGWFNGRDIVYDPLWDGREFMWIQNKNGLPTLLTLFICPFLVELRIYKKERTNLAWTFKLTTLFHHSCCFALQLKFLYLLLVYSINTLFSYVHLLVNPSAKFCSLTLEVLSCRLQVRG